MLRAIYRSYGGENLKGRPPFYSKHLSLLSFVRAAEAAGVVPVFLNDGPIPDSRLALMELVGEVVPLRSSGMRASYLGAIDLAISGRWGPEEVVWFSEDDYLYRPDALFRLGEAAEALPEVEYFALYASTPEHPAKGPGEPDTHRPAGWRDLPPWHVGGQDWTRVYSTTSSFGARVGSLAEDRGIIRFCMVPHRRMLRDHDTCLLLQGFEPYGYLDLARQAVGATPGAPRERVRSVVLAPFRLATNIRAHRRSSRRRILLAADPNVATHLESDLLSPGVDWPTVAAETVAWAEERNLPVAAGAPGG